MADGRHARTATVPEVVARMLTAAGATDVGRQRHVNEDRFHIDIGRGIFIVVDGVGGQAAGGKAADTAISMLRERLERQTGPATDRVREAITIANNEIHRLASLRPEWQGMACVMTVLLVVGGRAVVGHVGDTRLYRLRNGGIQKVTPDHSPVGEREDASEISEIDAMRHPRRNEVYRDVGSDEHGVADPDFIHLAEIDFPSNDALLLCSDGLTDMIPSAAVQQAVRSRAGRPDKVVATLIAAANEAGGKDNVTVVYVEGELFAGDAMARADAGSGGRVNPDQRGASQKPVRRHSRLTVAALLVGLVGVLSWQVGGWPASGSVTSVLGSPAAGAIVVRPGESIMAAVERALPGFDVVVEPGEYRERLVLKDNVRLVSRVPRGATLRLPVGAAESDPLVTAVGIAGAELAGFRIVGDAATPLGVGLFTRDAGVRLVDIEVSGAASSAADLGPGDGLVLVGSEIHDNPGGALVIRTGATPRIVHNVFAKNGTAERAPAPIVLEIDTQPHWSRNVFQGLEPQAIAGIDAATRLLLTSDNWFVAMKAADPAVPRPGRGARGR